MQKVMIREAKSGDADYIEEIEKKCFPMPWSRRSILNDIEKNDIATILVAEVDSCVVGYVGVWCVAGEGMINNIAVDPEYRRNHIGRELLETLVRRLDKERIEMISLEVRPSNYVAKGLYQELGFVEQGKRPKYYEDNGEDAVIMIRYSDRWNNVER